MKTNMRASLPKAIIAQKQKALEEGSEDKLGGKLRFLDKMTALFPDDIPCDAAYVKDCLKTSSSLIGDMVGLSEDVTSRLVKDLAKEIVKGIQNRLPERVFERAD